MIPMTLLDSDVLSALMRSDAAAVERARAYLESHAQLAFSLITRYEILRGLKARKAMAQLARFEAFCETCQVIPVSDEIVVRASDIYADLHQRGALIGDADILIAATDLTHDLVLSTNNDAHFRRIEGLQIVNWLK
jgi:tRNA(fMet)-specific endonuclease VapC